MRILDKHQKESNQYTRRVYTKGRANKKKFRAIPMLSDLHSKKKKNQSSQTSNRWMKKKNLIFFPSQPQTSTEFCLHAWDMYHALNLKREERGGVSGFRPATTNNVCFPPWTEVESKFEFGEKKKGKRKSFAGRNEMVIAFRCHRGRHSLPESSLSSTCLLFSRENGAADKLSLDRIIERAKS